MESRVVRLLVACSFALALAFACTPASHAQSSKRAAASSETVTFRSGGVALAATLHIPAGDGPFPGVVIVHGSGSSDRSNPWTAAYASALVEEGIAVLHPDKRGAGESEGDWRTATFFDLADDAVAALDVLAARPDIDRTRVGVAGFSQGGHIAPVAALRSPAASFVINISGSVVPIMDQIGDELRKMGEREGLSEDGIETVQTLHERAVRYALTGEEWGAYADMLKRARSSDLGETEVIQGFPDDEHSGAWEFLRTIGDFDPLPYWKEVGVPALFLYGGRDENVDVFKSADVIEESLTSAGLPYTLMLFRNNGHALFREDAIAFIARWIRDGEGD